MDDDKLPISSLINDSYDDLYSSVERSVFLRSIGDNRLYFTIALGDQLLT
jgi:hypothetical protein